MRQQAAYKEQEARKLQEQGDKLARLVVNQLEPTPPPPVVLPSGNQPTGGGLPQGPPGGGGGSGGGGGRGGQGQGANPAAPNPPPAQQAGALPGANGAMKGHAPEIFDGQRKNATKFMREFGLWKICNVRNKAMINPFQRIALALSYMKGVGTHYCLAVGNDEGLELDETDKEEDMREGDEE